MPTYCSVWRRRLRNSLFSSNSDRSPFRLEKKRFLIARLKRRKPYTRKCAPMAIRKASNRRAWSLSRRCRYCTSMHIRLYRSQCILNLSNSDLPNFRKTDTPYKSNLGGTTKRTARYVCYPSTCVGEQWTGDSTIPSE